MSYRKITVKDKEYKYVTGKTHTKVVGIGVAKNTDIGTYFWKAFSPCGDKQCSCDPYEEYLGFRVSPKDIANYIEFMLDTTFPITKDSFPMNKIPEGYKVNSVRKIEYQYAEESDLD